MTALNKPGGGLRQPPDVLSGVEARARAGHAHRVRTHVHLAVRTHVAVQA